MAKRIVTGIVGVIVLLVILCSNNLYLLGAVVSVISLMAMYELYKVTGLWEYKHLIIAGGVFSVFIMFFQFSGVSSFFGLMFFIIVTLFLFMILEYKKITFEKICMVFLISLIVPIFFLQIVKVRLLQNGEFLIYLIFIASFVTDAMAYFVGTAVGMHKFAPHISPNKTLEGAIGGLLGGGLGFVVFGYCMEYLFFFKPNYMYLFLFGLISAVVAEIGDLAASAIKRQFAIKDYGDIMPGHGGVMDRFDSVLFVAPFIYLILFNFHIFI